MKKIAGSVHTKAAILVVVLCLRLPPRGFSQSPGEKVTLELGTVTVWLGMPQQEALSKFATAGYKVQAGSDTTWVLNGEHPYNVEFTAGRLSFADRSWNGKDVDPMDAVIGALGVLGQYGGSTCEVSHDPLTTPDSSLDRVFVSCGKRSVVIMKGKINGNKIVGVEEQIGRSGARA